MDTRQLTTEIARIDRTVSAVSYTHLDVYKRQMVYGLAYWLLFQDDENDKANVCNMMYEQNKVRFTKAAYADVVSNY